MKCFKLFSLFSFVFIVGCGPSVMAPKAIVPGQLIFNAPVSCALLAQWNGTNPVTISSFPTTIAITKLSPGDGLAVFADYEWNTSPGGTLMVQAFEGSTKIIDSSKIIPAGSGEIILNGIGTWQ